MLTVTPKSFPQLLAGQILTSQFCRVSAVPSPVLCTASPRPVLLPSLSPVLTIGKWVRQPKLLIPPLFKFAALEASSPVQIHSTLPLPLCIKILTRNKSLNPGDLNWKLHPEVCLTPGYNLSFSQDISCQSSSKNLLLRGRTSLGQHPNSSRAEGENLLVLPAPHRL